MIVANLDQQLFRYFTRNVGQPEMAALEFVGQPLVVDAQAMQDGRLQIVDVHRVGDHVVAVVVGLADHYARA